MVAMKTAFKQLMTPLSMAFILGFTACNQSSEDSAAKSGQIVSSGKADIGGAFTLLNQDGVPVTEKDLLGRPTLTYFGFTYCPDICPLALQKLGYVLSGIDPEGEYYRSVLFSVDPERDTPEALKLYVNANGFPKGLQGFTGTQEQMDKAIKAYKVYAVKNQEEGGEDYLVDHSDIIYLFDAKGEFVTFFGGSSAPQDMIEKLSQFKKNNPI